MNRVKSSLIMLLVFALGLALGLIVLGWWLFPVEWTQVTLEMASPAWQENYLRAAIDSYEVNHDRNLAINRYNNLGEYGLQTLRAIQANPGSQSPQAVQAYRLAVAGGGEIAEKPAEAAEQPRAWYWRLLQDPLRVALLILGLLLVIGLIALGRFRRQVNWPLWVGCVLILFVLALAIWGPSWAPRDPLQENYIVRVGKEWLSAPFPPFKLREFPLGSDTIGRDVLSQLLWAVRPTLILVAMVAFIRLVIGLLIGLLAGWSAGRLGRVLDVLIAAALAIPVLIIALAVIAAVGIDLGVQAFILGLAATGWAETARLVREQTRNVKGQPFIEAARALGVSNVRLLFRNTLRHVSPLVWMLLAFEVSSTLLTAAALGFLGYYIGGEVWTPITDTAAVRSSGMPELGLMVATVSSDIYTGPWKMVAAGSVIFITILGFNLLGEGLRLRLGQPSRSRGRWGDYRERLWQWFEHNILHPTSLWYQASPRRAAAIGLAVLIIASALVWWGWRSTAVQRNSAAVLPIPGGHLWAAERHDPYGSLQTRAVGINTPRITWRRNVNGGAVGGPAVTADGTLYVLNSNGQIMAFQPDGSNVWVSPVSLRQDPVGVPALSDQGRIYATDGNGGLTAVSPLAEILWRFEPAEEGAATSGPVVDPTGNIYYLRGGRVQTVSPQGQELWNAIARDTLTNTPPAIASQAGLIFVLDGVLNQVDGARMALENLPDTDQFFVGGDGGLYGRSEHVVYAWQYIDGIAQLVQEFDWDWRQFSVSEPRDAGVSQQGLIWLLYYSRIEDAQFIWLDREGNVLSSTRFPHRQTRVMAVDNHSTVYLCGTSRLGNAECLAVQPGEDQPAWLLQLPEGSNISGGALIDGRLYVTLEDGPLYAIDEASP